MLFEFHRQQNSRKPGTVHATYLIAGKRRANDQHTNNDEDSIMQSSPPMASSPPGQEDSPVLSVTLAREEDLDELRSSYESIASIHIYSLGPTSLRDVQALSDASREVFRKHSTEDPLETATTYGSIINKGVRRRAGRRPPPSAPAAPPPTSKAQSASVKKEAEPSKPSKPETNTQDSQTSSKSAKGFFGKESAKKETTPKDTPASSSTVPAKRANSGGIAASFAKAKPAIKRENTNTSEVSPAVSTAINTTEDSPMKDVSDEEEDAYVPPPQKPEENKNDNRKLKKEREEALLKMMEDDEENAEDSKDVAMETPAPGIIDVKKAPKVEEEKTPKVETSKENPEVPRGRRRGRRRVMKKKTIKDEEGYLGELEPQQRPLL